MTDRRAPTTKAGQALLENWADVDQHYCTRPESEMVEDILAIEREALPTRDELAMALGTVYPHMTLNTARKRASRLLDHIRAARQSGDGR